MKKYNLENVKFEGDAFIIRNRVIRAHAQIKTEQGIKIVTSSMISLPREFHGKLVDVIVIPRD